MCFMSSHSKYFGRCSICFWWWRRCKWLDNDKLYHKDTLLFKPKFREDKEKLLQCFCEVANRFSKEKSGLLNIATREIMDDCNGLSVVQALNMMVVINVIFSTTVDWSLTQLQFMICSKKQLTFIQFKKST